MKVLIGAVAAAMLFCGSAAAQTQPTPPATPATPAVQVDVPPSRCGEFPASPAQINGERTSPDEMQAALTTYQAWDTEYRAVLACRRTEAEESMAIAGRRREDYNAGAASINTYTTTFNAEIEEYNQRQNRPRPRHN